MASNFSREPFHKKAGSIFAQNVQSLRITVDGVHIPSRDVISVYRSPYDRDPYIVVFVRDENGNIVEQDGSYQRREIIGAIEVGGNPSFCSCYHKRRIKHWWREMNKERPVW